MTDVIEQLRVLQQLGRTYRAFLSAYEKQVGHFLPRWRILLHLYTLGKPCPQKQLGDALHIDAGALSRLLSALESLGWITRTIDSQDRRITNVVLTAAGEEQVAHGLPKRTAFIERTLGDISQPQLDQLMEALLMLESRLNIEDDPLRVSQDNAIKF